MLILAAALSCLPPVQAGDEDFAEPPDWTDEVQSVFFDDARQALSYDAPPPSPSAAKAPAVPTPTTAEDPVWQELITNATLEAAVKSSVVRATTAASRPARFKASGHNECRRELTLLGTLFGVISQYPGDVRWKAAAAQFEQLCLQTAEACATGSESSLAETQTTLAALGELLSGQVTVDMPTTHEPLVPEFAALMQQMEQLVEHRLLANLSQPTQFRRQSHEVSEIAQLLAMLSQVIRHDKYGYGDDDRYKAHAEALRDSAQRLNEAALGKDFTAATQAAITIGRSCTDCHVDFRG